MIKNIISTTAVLIAILFISVIQYQWLKSSAERDITELYKTLNFTLFRSISYELADSFFAKGGVLDLEYSSEDKLRDELESISNEYIKDIGYVFGSGQQNIYSDDKWVLADSIPGEKRDRLDVPSSDPLDVDLIPFDFQIKGPPDPIIVFATFDIIRFYEDKVDGGIGSILDKYDLIWYSRIPDGGKVLNERTYSFSPIRFIRDILSSKDPQWLMGVNFFLGNSRPKNHKDSNFRATPGEPDGGNGESLLYLDVKENGRSLVFAKEKALTVQWLSTVLLSLGLGVVFIFILNQMNKLKILRAREKEFVASITHELRTPLAVIQSAADNIKSGIVNPSRMEQYGTLITDQSKRLSSMIEGILLFSRFEGKAVLTPHLVEIETSALESQLLSVNESIKSQYGVDVLLDFGLPESFASDLESLELILTNLIINSAKHAYRDGGTIRVKGHIKLPNYLVFVVEDDGVGIGKTERKHIFEPFFRGVLSHENQTNGSGLGLFLTFKKVKLLGGKIDLESPYSRADLKSRSGCRFTVTIPYNRVIKGEENA